LRDDDAMDMYVDIENFIMYIQLLLTFPLHFFFGIFVTSVAELVLDLERLDDV
jgi:hypothetical protein